MSNFAEAKIPFFSVYSAVIIMIRIQTFVNRPIDENTYVVSDGTLDAVIIDCGALFPDDQQAIADYKRIRPIVQFGDIYRIVSPYDNHGFASMMHVAPDKHAAVFYWWRISNFQDDHFSTARFAGLDPDRMYKVTELNSIDRRPLAFEGKSFSGRFLMENGLNIPVSNDPKYPGMKSDWSSRVLLLEAL